MDRKEKLDNLKINLEDSIKKFLENSNELKNFSKKILENIVLKIDYLYTHRINLQLL